MTPRKLLALVFLLSLPLVTTRLRGADEIEYFSYLRSMAFDRDLEFGNEYAHFHALDPAGLAGFKATFLDLREPRTGAHINFAPLGSALLWAPFYALAHAGVLVARAFGAEVPADGFSRPYVAAVCYASALYAFAGLFLLFETLRRHGHFPQRAALLAVLATWAASPLLYYTTVAPGFAHANSFFCVALLLCLSLRAFFMRSASVFDWVLCGAAAGLCALVREQDGLFLVLPLLLLALILRRRGGLVRVAAAAAAMVLAALVVFIPQLAAYHAINGSYGPSRLVARKMSFGSPHFLAVLVDPAHGFLWWTPLALLAAAGLLALVWKQRAAWALALIAAFFVQVAINGSVLSWTQAGAFGARRFVSTYPLLAFGLAMAFAELLAGGRRFLAALVLSLFTWWNISLMVQFALRIMDRQGLAWPAVAVNQFTAVPPRLVRTAWLFVTDRERLVREAR